MAHLYRDNLIGDSSIYGVEENSAVKDSVQPVGCGTLSHCDRRSCFVELLRIVQMAPLATRMGDGHSFSFP
jgi:hypothetical protein